MRECARDSRLSASVYTLFDEDRGYTDAEDHTQDTIPQSRRALRLRATFRFGTKLTPTH